MTPEQFRASIPTVERIWIEIHEDSDDARDVIVRMEDGAIYTALFVTLPYMRRQMELTHQLCQLVDGTVPIRFATLDTPHVLVENLDREGIEDTIDNLLALEIFETMFTRVTEEDKPDLPEQVNGNGKLATQEVAAVVLSDVLVVED